MNQDKIKRKIKEGYTDSDIANMSGVPVEEIAKLRGGDKPAETKEEKPAPEKKVEAPKASAAPKQTAGVKKGK